MLTAEGSSSRRSASTIVGGSRVGLWALSGAESAKAMALKGREERRNEARGFMWEVSVKIRGGWSIPRQERC
jgi:hypothetical protein